MRFMATTSNIKDNQIILSYSLIKSKEGNPIVKSEEMSQARSVERAWQQRFDASIQNDNMPFFEIMSLQHHIIRKVKQQSQNKFE